jgi:hypothetical protein
MLKTKAVVVKKPATVKAKASAVDVKKPSTVKPKPRTKAVVKAKASAVDVNKPATVKAKPRTKAVAKAKASAVDVKKPATVKAKPRTKAVAKAKASAVDVNKPATVKAKPRTKAVVKPKPRKRYKGGELQEDDIKNLLKEYFDFYNIYVEVKYDYPKNNEIDFKRRIKNIENWINAFNTNLNGENTDGFKYLNTFQKDFNSIYNTSYKDKDGEDYMDVIKNLLSFTKRLDETIIVPIIEIIEIENNKFHNIYVELSSHYMGTDAYEDFLEKPKQKTLV